MTEQQPWPLPESWASTTIGEVRVDASTTITPSRTPETMFELYSVPSYSEGSPEIVSGEGIGSNKQTVQADTVLLCKINPRINRVWIVRGHSPHVKVASTEWIPFFPLDGLEPGYLQYFMRQDAFRDHLAMRASGVGGSLMRVRPGTFSGYPLPLAPFPEQRRIVAEIEARFTRLDAAISALKRVKAKLRRYKSSVLKAACEGRLVPTEAALARAEGRDYEPAAVLLQRILAERRSKWEEEHPGKRYQEPEPPNTSALPELPEGWSWTSLGSCFDVTIGGTPSREVAAYWGGGVPWVSSGEVRNKRITTTRETITENGLQRSNAKLQPAGTVLLAMIGEGKTRGQAAILDMPAATNQNVASITCSSTEVSPQWVFHWLMSHYEDTRKSASGGMQYALNSARIRAFTVPLPPLAEQHRIVAEAEQRLSVAHELEQQVELALRRADRLRQSILKSAFEGRLVPQDPSDEPAGGLLERIRAAREAGKRGRTAGGPQSRAVRGTQPPLFPPTEA